MASPLLPEQPLHAERRLPWRYVYKVIWQSIRAFAYGFVLFGGIVLIPELAFSSDMHNNPIWLAKFVLVSASAGGAMFVFSWFCLFVLWKIVRDLMRKGADV